jgi:hypothetical protein
VSYASNSNSRDHASAPDLTLERGILFDSGFVQLVGRAEGKNSAGEEISHKDEPYDTMRETYRE